MSPLLLFVHFGCDADSDSTLSASFYHFSHHSQSPTDQIPVNHALALVGTCTAVLQTFKKLK